MQHVCSLIKLHGSGSIMYEYDIGTRVERKFRGYSAVLDEK